MSRRRLAQTLVITLLLSVVMLGTVSAQPGPADPMLASLPNGGWYTAFQVQNVSDQDGTLSLLALRVQGETDETYSNTYNLGAKRLLTYNPGLPPNFPTGNRIGFSPELPEGFIGSVALSADVPIVAVTNLANYPLGSVGISGGHASAQYQGISGEDTDTQIRFPLVKRNFYGNTTTFYVQAAGSDANVTITYNMADGTTVSEGPVFVAANRMAVFTPPDSVKCASGGSDSCLGAATVTSDAPVAGVYVEHPEAAATPAGFALSTRGFTTADLGTTLFAPITKNDFYGGTTGLSVQNAGDTATDITVVFTVARVQAGSEAEQAGVSVGQQYTAVIQNVQPGTAAVFTPFRNTVGGMHKGVFASAKITSTGGQPLVAIVNEIHPVEGQQVYAAFSEARASRKVAAPLVKEAFHGAGTGIAVQNTGSEPTDITISYTDIGGTTYVLGPVTLQGGQGTSFYKVSDPARGFPWVGSPLPKGSLSAVIIESTAEPIVAVIQERDEDPADSNGQLDSMNYEGFPTQ